MRKAKVVEDYSKFLVDALSPFAHSVLRQTTTSPFIAKGADLVKPLAAALALLDADVAATDYPTPAQTAQRDLLRAAVATELGRLAKRLNLDYPADEPALLSSGLVLAAAGTQALASGTVLMVFELLDGYTAGCLLLKLDRPTGTIQNLIRYTTDEKLHPSNWAVAVGGGREREIGPFPSGTRVWVMVAALTGSTTEPQYSAVKTRIVQ